MGRPAAVGGVEMGHRRSGKTHVPAHIRPIIRVPAMEVRTMGTVSASSDSKTE